MPSEDDLRRMFEGASAPNSLDPARIIARSRARRIPQQIGAGAVGTLAVAGISVIGVQSLQVATPTMSSLEQYEAPVEGNSSMDTEAAKRLPAEQINQCGATVSPVEPSYYGLIVEPVFPAAVPSGTAPVVGAVRLTNTSDIRVVGTTNPAAAITLAKDGLVLWHSSGVMVRSIMVVDLAPGESLEYPATFVPVQCSSEADLESANADSLTPAPAGVYQLSALIYFAPDDSMPPTPTTELDLVSGPSTTVMVE